MISKLKKSELIEVAEELEIDIPSGAKVITIKDLIEKSEIYKDNYEFVKTVVESIIDRKKDYEKNEAQKVELEKLKLAQLEKQLELANLQKDVTQKIQQLDIWWNGPSFLSSSSCPNFNDDPGVSDDEYLLEVKRTAKNSELNNDPMINLSICNNPSFLQCILDISNNYSKIVRILSYVFRFVKNLKEAVKTTGPLNAEELNYAETFLIKNVQIQEFAKDVSSLQKHHCVPPGMLSRQKQQRSDLSGRLIADFGLEDWTISGSDTVSPVDG
ncbi:hypothetical protein HNY73_010709 [Argiope bruennichi]|uniref:Uncharacterized protein n=1 Tax=Argiope bruennichi TaxID=94029 RepID=A0A8T0F1W5_ARGBR|nr:hypothetical protein HNY73_010709 [Argiope bruennichi]